MDEFSTHSLDNPDTPRHNASDLEVVELHTFAPLHGRAPHDAPLHSPLHSPLNTPHTVTHSSPHSMTHTALQHHTTLHVPHMSQSVTGISHNAAGSGHSVGGNSHSENRDNEGTSHNAIHAIHNPIHNEAENSPDATGMNRNVSADCLVLPAISLPAHENDIGSESKSESI